jgi:hypothetical protein
MTTTTQPITAQAAADQAAAHLADLQERVRNGDPNVTASELDQARSQIGFTALRIEAEQRAHTLAAAQQRKATYSATAKKAAELLGTSDQAIIDAYREALTATRHLFALATQRSDAQRAVYAEVKEIYFQAEVHGEARELAAAGITAVNTGSGAVTVICHDGERRSLDQINAGLIAATPLATVLEDERAANGWTYPGELSAVNIQCASVFRLMPELTQQP